MSRRLWRAVREWWFAPASPLEFWMPGSGIFGGLLGGLFALLVLAILHG